MKNFGIMIATKTKERNIELLIKDFKKQFPKATLVYKITDDCSMDSVNDFITENNIDICVMDNNLNYSNYHV